MRALAGDRSAFGELFALNRQSIYRICLRRLRDPGLAEDALQDAFVLALRAMPRFDPARRFFPWLATIALHRASDIQQRQGTVRPAGFIEVAQEGASSPDLATRVTDRAEVEEALSLLTAGQRRMVWLHDVEGWSYSDLARAEGKTEIAVRSVLFRARASLRTLLRTLGLVGPGLAAMRRRVAREVDRLASAAAADLAGLGASTVGMVAAAAVAAAIVLTTIAGSPPGGRLAPPASAAFRTSPVPEIDAPVVSAALVRRDGPVGSTRTTITAGPVHQTTTMRRPRPGAAAPSQSHVRIEVVGPDGTVLTDSDTQVDCDQVGSVPPELQSGPVRAVC